MIGASKARKASTGQYRGQVAFGWLVIGAPKARKARTVCTEDRLPSGDLWAACPVVQIAVRRAVSDVRRVLYSILRSASFGQLGQDRGQVAFG